MKKLFLLLLFILFLSATGISYATTHNVPSPYDDSDVQDTINDAGCVTGDVVYIPACTVTWTGTVSIPNSKKITIQGAGSTNTVITHSGIAIDLNESGSRVTGIEFITPIGGAGQLVFTNGVGWRIDHCKFTNDSGALRNAITVSGMNVTTFPEGLIDNNVINECKILVVGAGSFTKDCIEWARAVVFGTVNSVYIEDNAFSKTGNGTNVIDTNRAGCYVARYNTFNGLSGQAHVHSLQSSNERGPRNWEFYGNEWTGDSWGAMFIRAGTGYIWGNTIGADWGHSVIFDNVRSNYDIGGDAGECNGASDWDGNELANGWPCRDQIGRGLDASLWTTENPYPSQASMPVYIVNNRHDGSIGNVYIHNGDDAWIVSDRDYFNEVASFDGTTGAGSGTFAEMNNITPNKTGVGWWCTDKGGDWNANVEGVNDGCLYVWDGDSWEVEYTPYDYPHPLRGPEGKSFSVKIEGGAKIN